MPSLPHSIQDLLILCERLAADDAGAIDIQDRPAADAFALRGGVVVIHLLLELALIEALLELCFVELQRNDQRLNRVEISGATDVVLTPIDQFAHLPELALCTRAF